MRRWARWFLYLSAILWTVTLLSPFVSPAWAEVNGNCEATIKSVDVRGRSSTSASDAIDVDENEVVAVAMTSPAGFASHKIDLEIAGVRRTVSSKTDDGDTQWSGTVNVKDYAWAGAGLYKVIGSATLSDGSSCSGAALINVTRNPLTTVVGGVAAAATVVGVAGVGASSAASAVQGMRAGRKVENFMMDQVGDVGPKEEGGAPPTWQETWEFAPETSPSPCCTIVVLPALLLTGAAMLTGGGAPITPGPAVRLPRAPWRPKVSAVGLLGGLLAGAGIVVLLQQYAVAPLTRSLATEGLVIGLIVGIILPSLGRFWGVMHENGAIARAERRLNDRAQKAPPEAGEGLQESGPQTPPGGGEAAPPEEPHE